MREKVAPKQAESWLGQVMVKAGVLFERMVYENFIVGPRCSAVVFKVLSRRLRFVSRAPPISRSVNAGKGLGFYFSTT